MLQQTQVARVIPKYDHFMARWPTIRDLSNASLSEVVTEWRGLGYNRRAKYLLETTKIIVHKYDGSFPSEYKALRALPGFGPYMVSALRVFAFGEQEPVLDVNVTRVYARIENAQCTMDNKKEIQEIAKQSIPKDQADQWHQALMDFGSLVCTAKDPKCATCPISRVCAANNTAKARGFDTFACWIEVQPKIRKQSKKDMGKKFEETDRYFRGRVIDFLRTGERPMTELQRHVIVVHKLGDLIRFGAIIESLVVDGLIRVSGTTVALA